MGDARIPAYESWPSIPLAPDQVEGLPRPAYREEDGKVYLGGRVRRANGTQYTSGHPWLLATMPQGFWPVSNNHTVVAVEMGAGIYAARLEIHPDGSLVAWIPPGATCTEGLRWISLDGISYPLPQPATAVA